MLLWGLKKAMHLWEFLLNLCKVLTFSFLDLEVNKSLSFWPSNPQRPGGSCSNLRAPDPAGLWAPESQLSSGRETSTWFPGGVSEPIIVRHGLYGRGVSEATTCVFFIVSKTPPPAYGTHGIRQNHTVASLGCSSAPAVCIAKSSQRNRSKPFIRSRSAGWFFSSKCCFQTPGRLPDLSLLPPTSPPLWGPEFGISFSDSFLLIGSISSQSQIELWKTEVRRILCSEESEVGVSLGSQT